MAQLTVHVNARPYVVGCEDGEEPRLRSLAEALDARVREAAAGGAPGAGQVGETRLMLLGALVLADELREAEEKLAAAQARLDAFEKERDRFEARAVAALEAAAAKLEGLATG